jgi:hypothetical protein
MIHSYQYDLDASHNILICMPVDLVYFLIENIEL